MAEKARILGNVRERNQISIPYGVSPRMRKTQAGGLEHARDAAGISHIVCCYVRSDGIIKAVKLLACLTSEIVGSQ